MVLSYVTDLLGVGAPSRDGNVADGFSLNILCRDGIGQSSSFSTFSSIKSSLSYSSSFNDDNTAANCSSLNTLEYPEKKHKDQNQNDTPINNPHTIHGENVSESYHPHPQENQADQPREQGEERSFEQDEAQVPTQGEQPLNYSKSNSNLGGEEDETNLNRVVQFSAVVSFSTIPSCRQFTPELKKKLWYRIDPYQHVAEETQAIELYEEEKTEPKPYTKSSEKTLHVELNDGLHKEIYEHFYERFDKNKFYQKNVSEVSKEEPEGHYNEDKSKELISDKLRSETKHGVEQDDEELVWLPVYPPVHPPVFKLVPRKEMKNLPPFSEPVDAEGKKMDLSLLPSAKSSQVQGDGTRSDAKGSGETSERKYNPEESKEVEGLEDKYKHNTKNLEDKCDQDISLGNPKEKRNQEYFQEIQNEGKRNQDPSKNDEVSGISQLDSDQEVDPERSERDKQKPNEHHEQFVKKNPIDDHLDEARNEEKTVEKKSDETRVKERLDTELYEHFYEKYDFDKFYPKFENTKSEVQRDIKRYDKEHKSKHSKGQKKRVTFADKKGEEQCDEQLVWLPVYPPVHPPIFQAVLKPARSSSLQPIDTGSKIDANPSSLQKPCRALKQKHDQVEFHEKDDLVRSGQKHDQVISRAEHDHTKPQENRNQLKSEEKDNVKSLENRYQIKTEEKNDQGKSKGKQGGGKFKERKEQGETKERQEKKDEGLVRGKQGHVRPRKRKDAVKAQRKEGEALFQEKERHSQIALQAKQLRTKSTERFKEKFHRLKGKFQRNQNEEKYDGEKNKLEVIRDEENLDGKTYPKEVSSTAEKNNMPFNYFRTCGLTTSSLSMLEDFLCHCMSSKTVVDTNHTTSGIIYVANEDYYC